MQSLDKTLEMSRATMTRAVFIAKVFDWSPKENKIRLVDWKVEISNDLLNGQ